MMPQAGSVGTETCPNLRSCGPNHAFSTGYGSQCRLRCPWVEGTWAQTFRAWRLRSMSIKPKSRTDESGSARFIRLSDSYRISRVSYRP